MSSQTREESLVETTNQQNTDRKQSRIGRKRPIGSLCFVRDDEIKKRKKFTYVFFFYMGRQRKEQVE